MNNFIWFKNFPAGRFANVAFQYTFLQYLKLHTFNPVCIGDDTVPESYVAQNLLGFDYNYQIIPTEFHFDSNKRASPPYGRHISPNVHLDSIMSACNDGSKLVLIDDYYQFDTRFFCPDTFYGKLFKLLFLPSPDGNKFQQLLHKYKNDFNALTNNNYIIAIHIRLGDYLDHERNDDQSKNPFYTIKFDSLIIFLRQLLIVNRLHNPLIYLASDNIPYCLERFADSDLSVKTRFDFFRSVGLSEEDELVQDISVLSSADFSICSNSSFSIFSVLINENNPTTVRFSKSGEFVPFDRYNTVILEGL